MSLLARVKSVQKASMDAQGFSAQALAARDFSDQGSSGDAAVFEPLNHEVQSLHDQHTSRLKHDLVKELGLDTIARIAHSATLHNAYDELSVSCQTILNTSHYEGLSEANHPELIKEVLDEVLGFGPLQPLLDDASVTEIMVNGTSSLFFERAGKMCQSSRIFESKEQILMVVDRILAPLGRRLDEQHPLVNARLPNGYRVNVVNAPVALDGPILTIRKFSDRIASLAQLVQLKSLPAWYAQLLSWAVKCREDIAVAGGTGSGKTTLLNALSSEISPQERIITIEDSAELRFDTHPHVVRLEMRESSIEGTGEVSIRDLMKNALRMRPNRIIVGEVRGEECIDMLQAMNTGHDGSLTTLHAGSAREAILRLVLMARFGMNLPVDVIEEQVATALDLIVMSARMPDGSRVITTTSLVQQATNGQVKLEELVSFDMSGRRWRLRCTPPFMNRALYEGIVTQAEVQQWKSTFSYS
ncbi:CpaF family protein [Atopobium deltae]|uniref:Type II/IV secretion system protein n=1 Tax=Atopobium deltae TaxID=1393034 RepID=A0A133XW06_9ACTN|nr:CpaF family protein [Atopobium deltae]KXB35111.1 type II/IV secretion system protein [Atopobium deltae]